MNGMHYAHNYLWTTESDYYTQTAHWELPPTSSIAQLTVTTYFEFDDEGSIDLGITRVEYLDGTVTRHIDYSNIPQYPKAVSINGLTRIDWRARVSNAWASWLLNVFFWDSVY